MSALTLYVSRSAIAHTRIFLFFNIQDPPGPQNCFPGESRNLSTDLGTKGISVRHGWTHSGREHHELSLRRPVTQLGRGTETIIIIWTPQELGDSSCTWACWQPLVRRDYFITLQVSLTHSLLVDLMYSASFLKGVFVVNFTLYNDFV